MNFLKKNSHIHFIAIGGSIMHSLAICLRNMGYKVTGSDDEIFDPAKKRLQKHALLPDKYGWFPEKINDSIGAIVLGMHAKSDNPELIKAKALNIKIYSFPEILFQFSKNKKRIVVAGSHGKTTITSMLMHAFKFNKLNFDYAVGASLEGFDQMVALSTDNPYIIIEGDEYLSSALDQNPKFLHYKPHHAILSGIEWDHINVYPDFELYLKAFGKFIESVDKKGSLIFYKEDKHLSQLIKQSETPSQTKAYTTPEYQIDEQGETHIRINDQSFSINIIGKHNYLNMQGAATLWESIGFEPKDFWRSMESFSLPGLRLEFWKKSTNQIIIRDFAHAPSKVFASVNAVREHFPNHHFTAILELHTYSSLTPEFIEHYKGVFDQTERAVIFLDEKALKLKGKEIPGTDFLKNAFGLRTLEVFRDADLLKQVIFQKNPQKAVTLLMSSGKFGGIKKENI